MSYYNFIIAGGSIPPMMAALEAIMNGNETYAYIGRGRLYNGISQTRNFNNLGFDETKTQSLESEDVFVAAINRIKSIKLQDKEAYFNFYIDESRALKAAAIAANSGLTKDDFHVYMLEDGIDTYKKFAVFYGGKIGFRPIKAFLLRLTKRVWFSHQVADIIADILKPFTSKEKSFLKKWFDSCVRKDFEDTVRLSEKRFKTIMSKTNNLYSDSIFSPDYKTPFAVATMENFTYMLQNRQKIDNIIADTKNEGLQEIFGIRKNAQRTVKHPKIVSGNVHSRVEKLNEQQKNTYITLMFSKYFDEVNKNFTRNVRYDQLAPEKKLIYVSSRFDTMFIHPVTDKKYGIGGWPADTAIPLDYEKLDDKYKSPFLFDREEDYAILKESIAKNFGRTDAPEEVVMKATAKVFNLYTDYVFVAKMLYMKYGSEYDVIIKNHPRTDLGTSEEWARSYRLQYGEDRYLDCGRCLEQALTTFFEKDSMGKYIGILSGSLSTENFEYLGADVYFGGQPSSVYNGLSDEANIIFIITDSDGPVCGEGDTHFDYSAISGLYNAGLLNYRDENAELKDAVFYNTGNTMKLCAEISDNMGNKSLYTMYSDMYHNWLSDKYPGSKDIDRQGFAIK